MSSGHSIAKRRTNEDEVRRYPINRLCALAGVTRQAFYKRDEDALLARLAIEQFVVQFVLGVRRDDDPKDNAMAERINNTVKNELLHGKTFGVGLV